MSIANQNDRLPGLATATLAAGLWMVHSAKAADVPASQPSAAVVALTTDIEKQFTVVQDVLNNPTDITSSARRGQLAPAIIPSLQKLEDDFNGLITADPDYRKEAIDRRAEFTMFLSLFGDVKATKKLADEAGASDADVALEGKRSQLMVAWLSSAQSPEAQSTVFNQMLKLARDHPESDQIAQQLLTMRDTGASSPALRKQLIAAVAEVMKNEVGDAVRMQMQAEKKQLASEAKQGVLENKPITVAGKKIDGQPFTTADWKGKVVLVDFWATWCPTCREELPRVEKAYADFHDKGLEIVGVSNDYIADDLAAFLRDNPHMPWAQLFDPAAAKAEALNPISQGFGIEGLPTMFLIDKKGILRSVNAEDNMDELIPKLLDEK